MLMPSARAAYPCGQMPKRITRAIALVWLTMIVALSAPTILVVAMALESVGRTKWALPLLPIIAYGLAALGLFRFLKQIPADQRQWEYANQMQSKSLRLVGFSFASLTFLLGNQRFYQQNDPVPTDAPFCFAIALASFLAAHFLGQFRMKEAWLYASAACFENGLWCIVLGMYFLFSQVLKEESLTIIVLVVVVMYWLAVLRNLLLHWSFARRLSENA